VAENPFLLPPGSAPAPRQEPTVPPRATPLPRDPDRYIAIPPSIESATHRISRPETAPTTIPEPVAEETRLAVPTADPARDPAPDAAGFALVLGESGRLELNGPVVLGRDPAPPAVSPAARPVRLVDPGKTVSKTHALLAPGEGGIRVIELHSTNGVAITSAGIRTVLAPGGEGIASLGSVIELGSFTVRVEAR
jgi:hypothetical protein